MIQAKSQEPGKQLCAGNRSSEINVVNARQKPDPRKDEEPTGDFS